MLGVTTITIAPVSSPKATERAPALGTSRGRYVLQDFNRRLSIAGDDMWADLDDGNPDFTKHTEGLMSVCMNFRFPEYIDYIVTDTRSTALVRADSFEQVLFTKVDPEGQANLSDHCPIAMVFRARM